MGMKCPLCKISMVVIERDKVELDFCANCRGIWFDAGELELLLDDMTGKDTRDVLTGLMSHTPDVCDEKRRGCPICRKTMQKIDLGKCGRLVVDACKSGHGMWFDGGEVGCLVEQLGIKGADASTKQDQLLFFVADTFKANSDIK